MSEKEKFWKRRSKHGRDKIFSSPEMLWEAACEYFQWVEDNPLTEYKAAQYEGCQVDLNFPKMRAMTLEGLYLFLGTGSSTWHDYRKKDGYEEFKEVIERVESVIRSQKFAGAAAGLLNAVIIARDLGLKEATSTEITGKDGGAIITASLTDEELAAEIKKYALE